LFAVILLLDNYDSFVHNLARYFRRLGCQTTVIRSDQIDVAGCAALSPSAIVISPGPRRPHEAGCSVEVVQRISPEIPILGVCLGHQAIGVAFGGAVIRCQPKHGMSGNITHDGKGLFAGRPSPMQVGRYHSLAVDHDRLPSELEVTAQDEGGLIMGLRHRSRPIFGVQFHPESVLTDGGLEMLDNFVAITRCNAEHAVAGGKVVS
jgi:anthranilate synthase/aminodeoxychorismate synthase-like glutamine amidotransferase